MMIARAAVRRWAVGLATLALLAGWAGGARAGTVYAHASQELTNFEFGGATVVGGLEGLTTSTFNVAIQQDASPPGIEAHINFDDASQAYVGHPPRPAENTFGQVGPTNPDYVRGDAAIGRAPFEVAGVAEGHLATLGGLSAGISLWSVSGLIDVATDGEVTLSFDFQNLLDVSHDAAADSSARAAYAFNFTIVDPTQDGALVFAAAPTLLNRGLGLAAPGALTLADSGSLSITSTALAAGTYQATLAGSSQVSMFVIPEPPSLALAGLPAVLGLSWAGWRHRRRRAVG